MDLTGTKILVVDDDLALSTILAEAFAKAGATTQVAHSCAEGIAAVKSFAPLIVVADLMMPDRSGFDLIRDIQKEKATVPQPLFVILTDSVSTEFVADAMETGVTTYLQKAEHDPADIVKIVSERYKASKE
jgi:DNA-binding response OmpR family regulator